MNSSQRDRHNFWILALHHIIIRIGWIFKTETVIMPGFLDALGVGGALRGCLPTLNKIGQSVPQFLFANRVRRMPLQKWSLAWVSFWQGLPWLALAGLVYWVPDLRSSWQAAAFLVIYAVFNVTFGNWVLLSGTIQGKLIPTEHRGRLLGVSNFWGCGLAALAAALLLGRWLGLGFAGYAIIFAVVGLTFLLAGVLVLGLDEPISEIEVKDFGLTSFMRDSWRLLLSDANFRRLIWAVTLYHMVLILFPHYAAYGRRMMTNEPASESQHLNTSTPQHQNLSTSRISSYYVLWVVVQNLMNGFGSALVGPLADRRGNRIALSMLTVLAAVTPLVAIGLGHLPLVWQGWGSQLYWIVFLLLGFTPITQRIIVNYTLEISPAADHALYLGTLQLAQGFPLLFSPAFGWLIDATSFEAVFLGGAGTILLGGVLAQNLVEPREAVRG